MLNYEKIFAVKTIKKEYKELLLEPIPNIKYTLGLTDEDNIFEWKLIFIGPKNTPYEGGQFLVKIKFQENYPSKGPIAHFITPIYHPDVNKRKSNNELLGFIPIPSIMWWSPNKSTIKEVISQINELFFNATCEHPYGIDMANEYREKKELFGKKAKYFTEKYANPIKNNNVDEDKVWDFSYQE